MIVLLFDWGATSHRTNQPTPQPTNPPTNQPTNQPTNRPNKPSYNHGKNGWHSWCNLLQVSPYLRLNGSWHCSIESRGSHLYHNPSPPPPPPVIINQCRGSGKAFDNMTQINIAFVERVHFSPESDQECQIFFYGCRPIVSGVARAFPDRQAAHPEDRKLGRKWRNFEEKWEKLKENDERLRRCSYLADPGVRCWLWPCQCRSTCMYDVRLVLNGR